MVVVQKVIEISWGECILNKPHSYRSALLNCPESRLLILAIV